MWKYVQSTGEMFKSDGTLLEQGYSGAPDYQNKPDYQCEKDKGPIPRGYYTLGQSYDDQGGKGTVVIPLQPYVDNEMCDRDGFLIHGDKIGAPGTASNGCIILSKPSRQEIATSQDKKLFVVKNSVLSSRLKSKKSKSYTVLLKSTDGSNSNGIQIMTRDNRWMLTGTGKIFNTRNGIYDLIGTNESRLLVLKSSGTIRIGDLRGFDPATTPEGSTGNGISDQTGIAFTWKAERSIEV